MLQHQRFFILISFLFAAFALSGCVSVNIAQPPPTKAKKISFKEPPSPFNALATDNADKAWQSQKTGATIAYLSECQPAVDSQLKTVESESLNAVTHPTIIETHTMNFNDREAIQTLASGTVDGIPVTLEIVVFKKNDCNFTLTFMGRKQKSDLEKKYFESFKESFVVP